MSLMDKGEDPPKGGDYPLDSTCYKILEEIGRGVSAIVYKAICIPVESHVVAIKAIDLEKSKPDFEAEMMANLCHPNILLPHCSFTVKNSHWVVMPFISGGSLQSIMASSYQHGLREPCIAAALKQILTALSYLHNNGHLHRDIKAANILIDSNGSVKLADFGVSASVYESIPSWRWAEAPYWVAPEVADAGHSSEADIWSFGITALELAHGKPPLSNLPPPESTMMSYIKKFRFPQHYDETKASKNNEFSDSFKNMVGLCLDHDPSKRPTAEKLLELSFFNNCNGPDLLIEFLVQRVPATEQGFENGDGDEDEDGDEEEDEDESVKHTRISGWKFSEEGFELDPIFRGDDAENERCDAAALLESIEFVRNGLDVEKKKVADMIARIEGKEVQTQEFMEMRAELEKQKSRISDLQMQLEFMTLRLSDQ